MKTGPRLLSHVQIVALTPRELLVRRLDECVELTVDAAAAQLVLGRLDGSPLEQCLADLPAAVQKLGRKLVEALDGVACTSDPIEPPASVVRRIAVVGRGAWACAIQETLVGLGEVRVVSTEEPGEAWLEPERLMADHDLVVVALESVTWAASRSLNRAALGSTRATALFVSLDPEAIRVGPSVTRAQPPCQLCERLELLGATRAPGEHLVAAGEQLRTTASEEHPEFARRVALGVIAREAATLVSRPWPSCRSVMQAVDTSGQIQTRRVTPVRWCPDCGSAPGERPEASLFRWDPSLAIALPLATAPRAAPWSGQWAGPSLSALQQALREAGTDEVRHAIASFHDHLWGTWSILVSWGLPVEVCCAGLFHSVYGSDAFDQPTFPVQERASVAALIGEEAERLVFLFCSLDRQKMGRSLESVEELPAEGWWVDNWRTGQRLRLARAEVGSLLALEAANLAEQCHRGDLSPGVWVARCAHWARLAESAGLSLPSLRGIRLTTEQERAAVEAYGRACGLALLEPTTALEHAREATRLNPWVGEPWLLAASLVSGERARSWAQTSLERMAGWATAWDKRSSWSSWMGRASLLAQEHGEKGASS